MWQDRHEVAAIQEKGIEKKQVEEVNNKKQQVDDACP